MSRNRSVALLTTLLCVGCPHAETINLSEARCGLIRYCSEIPNDGINHDAQGNAVPVVVSLTAGPGHEGVYVAIDGVSYGSPTGGGSGDTIANVALTNAAGDVVVLNAVFTHRRYQLGGTGRGGYRWVTSWRLEHGTLTRP